MARSDTLSAGERDVLEYLLRSRPEQRDRLQPYVRRAKAYSNECGCAMSGAFLVVAMALVMIRGFSHHGVFQAGILSQLVACWMLVFAAGLAGKLTGIAIARVRLALLYRDLRNQFAREEG